MIVGILHLKLLIPASHSLKEKRQVIRRIRDKVHNKFNVSLGEVGDNDNWKRASLGVSVVGNETRYVQSILADVEKLVESVHMAQVVERKNEILHFNEEGDLFS